MWRNGIVYRAVKNFVRHNSTNNAAKNLKSIKVEDIQNRIENIPIENYRNFSIVAHIDHGKSTLSDRLLEITGVISKTEGTSGQRVLDKLEVEKERGITIKAQTCSMIYNDKRNGQDFLLHLIDTPGHVDFRDEVSRSYKACNGAILLVDASKGVQSQTVANFYLAYSMGLKLIPVINKIDLNVAEVEKTAGQIESTFEMSQDEIIKVSSKSGINIQEKLLPAVIDRIPPPTGIKNKPFRALLVDSWYDSYLGVVLLVHVVDGSIKKGDKISSAITQMKYEIKEIGIMHPDRVNTGKLTTGQVGYIVPGMKNSQDAKIGDTFMKVGLESQTEILPGFEETKPMVFVGAFPADGVEFKALDDDINRLVLNDKSVTIEMENSNALGQGWRLGFLGSLHASVFKERLEKEYGSQLIITQPTVPYLIEYEDGTIKEVTNPNEFPTNRKAKGVKSIANVQEPYVEAIMTLPDEYLGNVITLCDNHRGKQVEIKYMDSGQSNAIKQVMLRYEIPLFELVDNFFGRLKSVSQGYATLDYEDIGFRPSDIVKLELLINGTTIDAITSILHRSKVNKVGTEWVKNFKKYVKSQQYEVVIQARINNSKIIARETIKARRKDVLAKLHASDITRRKKLLVKQKEGKKKLKMRSIGNIQINTDAYQEFLRR
ncbi:hypothetical protein Kpol_1009p8 [Vanderwaltozyma polyspora DSM 70294]|uniref:Translation factor GUF1, mitochondrial n=1 Tax=Vanderwaltozyma polyspora (strain ATCC 22028 / DSM 70294 / BCRC 21397 / CBS 2163 / NBRC 10782 / NRRL Y-8283 / UCD 57-17) TaxID=436907 RepID=GUF1_VANPO|nr:uncharacterized protein Kpol_1009p8 [Vanderwaltozyma polyspora DSM 70294]A7TPD4.1 RecName: Full=Translation factor GUF1, mitochondrial; AltName: Full=Elongation factor 4 homolog; Short=EF-4; AltName: Full=GTPase GUF1; AltName: Full=Ribosomal back-translocase [Vanderwaltozyma polyspora DSM 70294]EDO15862.1 hypothetical protein Kpol_1009p8 [Vanderwaltozyma polyspora DSM 70294]